MVHVFKEKRLSHDDEMYNFNIIIQAGRQYVLHRHTQLICASCITHMQISMIIKTDKN